MVGIGKALYPLAQQWRSSLPAEYELAWHWCSTGAAGAAIFLLSSKWRSSGAAIFLLSLNWRSTLHSDTAEICDMLVGVLHALSSLTATSMSQLYSLASRYQHTRYSGLLTLYS